MPQVLLPGSSELDTSHFRDTATAVRIMKADSEVGRFRSEWHRTADDTMLLVTTGAVRGKSFIDSVLIARRGLVPISEMSAFGSRVKHFMYNGPTVTLDSGSHTYPMNVFCFQELDDVLRSLPLREGYEVLLPLYSEGSDTLEIDTARVVSRETRGRWTIRFADPAIVATYQVDGHSRQIVGHEQVLRRNGAQYRYVEIPLAEFRD